MYRPTIGLEIHAELKTRTKMFCQSKNDTDETRPNVNTCPVCMGYPGTLPVINKEAVRSVLRLGVAVGGKIADYTEFDRKNYFYPDIPKGYQISQYKHPLVSGGELAGVKLTRIHLEEDTARSLHELGNSVSKCLLETEFPSGESYLDFNRAGVPLMEMVTEPVIHTAEEAVKFAKELKLLLQYLGISLANMEKGEMRVEANVSVSFDKSQNPNSKSQTNPKLGTKVEIKNLNSFKALSQAIEFEHQRQVEILERGESVIQETRGWDENKSETFSQRAKEESHDYRYFPDPDLPKIFLSEMPDFAPTELRRALPELPWDKRERLLKLGISSEHAEIYVTQPEWGEYFEEVFNHLETEFPSGAQLASNYITSELKKPVDAGAFADTMRMIVSGKISSRGAKEILKTLQEKGGEPRAIAEEKNLMQESDREILRKIVEEVLAENKKAPVQFLVGQAMKKSEGRANPVILQELFVEMLNR